MSRIWSVIFICLLIPVTGSAARWIQSTHTLQIQSFPLPVDSQASNQTEPSINEGIEPRTPQSASRKPLFTLDPLTLKGTELVTEVMTDGSLVSCLAVRPREPLPKMGTGDDLDIESIYLCSDQTQGDLTPLENLKAYLTLGEYKLFRPPVFIEVQELFQESGTNSHQELAGSFRIVGVEKFALKALTNPL